MYQWRIEHIGNLKSHMPQWRSLVKDDLAAFTEMYFHLYDFVRGDDEKLLPVDRALAAWQVLLPEQDKFPLASMWAQWVTTEFKRGVTRDLWRQLWEFARKIKSLDVYDHNDKWPTALDDFVDWARDKLAQRQTEAEKDAPLRSAAPTAS
jgi:DCN1-like protein 1/2